MDCNSLNLNINSGCDGSVGGIKKVWLMTAALTNLEWNEKEKLLITDYNYQNLPVEISPNARTSSFDMSVNNELNTIEYINRLVINFPLIETEKKHALDKMLSNDIYVVFLDGNGQYFYMTPDFGGRCVNLIGETGTKGGGNFYSLEFKSSSRRHIPEMTDFSIDCSVSFGPNTFFPTSFRSNIEFSEDIILPVNIDLFYEGTNFIRTYVANTNPYEVFYIKGTFGAPLSATSYTLVVSGITSCPTTTYTLFPTPTPIRDDKTTSEFFLIGNGTTLQVEENTGFSNLKNSFINIDGLQFNLYTKESYGLIQDKLFISGTAANSVYSLVDDFSTADYLTVLKEQMGEIATTPYIAPKTVSETPIGNIEQVKFILQTPIKDGYRPFVLSNTSMGFEGQNTNHNNFNFPNSHNWATNIKLYSLDGYYSTMTDGLGSSINGTISNEDIENNGIVLYNIEDKTENVSIDNIGVEFGYLSPYDTLTTFNYATKPREGSVFDLVNTIEPFNYSVDSFSSEYEKDLHYWYFNNDDAIPQIIEVVLSGTNGQKTYTYEVDGGGTLVGSTSKFYFERANQFTEFLRDIGITVHSFFFSEYDTNGVSGEERFNLYFSIDKDIDVISISEFIKVSEKQIYRNKLDSNPNPLYRIIWNNIPTSDFGLTVYDANTYSEGINLYEYGQYGSGFTVDYNFGTDVLTVTENDPYWGVQLTTYNALGENLTSNQTFNPTLTLTGFSSTLKVGSVLADVDYYYLNNDSYLMYSDLNSVDFTSNYNHNVSVLTNEYKLGLWGLPHDYYYVGTATTTTSPTLVGNNGAITCSSLLLDGSAEYIDCSNNAAFDFDRLDAFTFSVWVKPTGGAFPMIFSKYISGTGYRLFINTVSGNALQFEMDGSVGKITVRATTPINFNDWQLITITHDGSGTAAGIEMYVNGGTLIKTVLFDNLTSSILTSEPFLLGAEVNQPLYFAGTYSNARVWDIELSASTVFAEYNYGGLLPSPSEIFSLVLDTDIPTAQWNGSEYEIDDTSVTNATIISVNAEEADKIQDCPISIDCASLELDGIDDYIQAPINAAFDLQRTDLMSFEGWVKFNNLFAANAIISKWQSSKGIQFNVLSSGEISFSLQNNGGLNGLIVTTTGAAIITGVWYHLAVTYDGSLLASGVNIYKNGALLTNGFVSQSLSATILSPNNLWIGRVGNFYTDGLFNIIRGWQTELTPAEILTQYNGGTPLVNAVQPVDLILQSDCGNGATWNGSEFDIADNTGITVGYTTVNAEEADKIQDCPS